jgi:GTP-binding protein LepA
LNDASLDYEPETSVALGFGFRCGFLGLLHLEIIQERLRREFAVDLIATTPSVMYHVLQTNGDLLKVDNPAHMPPVQNIEAIEEPVVLAHVVTPTDYLGNIMKLCQDRAARSRTWCTWRRSGCASPTGCRWARSCSTSTTG